MPPKWLKYSFKNLNCYYCIVTFVFISKTIFFVFTLLSANVNNSFYLAYFCWLFLHFFATSSLTIFVSFFCKSSNSKLNEARIYSARNGSSNVPVFQF